MNKILPIAASLLLSTSLAAANPSLPKDSISVSASIVNDSLKQLNADIVLHSRQDTTAIADADLPARIVNTDEGDTYILSEGKAYPLQELLSGFEDGFNESETPGDIADQKLKEIGTLGILGILAICFGFPALVIIVAIILIIGFFKNRNRERNAIIAQAIDHDYQLPDSFYTNQPQHEQEGESETLASKPARDPRKFNSAITLIAVGLAVGIFFWAVDAPVGFVAGGIPLLLGIGRLIGYFYVPGFGAPTQNQHRNYYRNNQNDFNNDQNGRSCPPPPPGGHFYYDPRDPRYNGKQ